MSDKIEIAVFFTGGTILMQQEQGGVKPGEDFSRLLDDLSPRADVTIRPVAWANRPSPHMGAKHMLDLARDIDRALADEHVCGAVVLHGTDLLAETSFVLDLVLTNDKPVVTTGSMRHMGEAGYDGIRNLRNGILACLFMERGTQVLIQMADFLFTARDAVKLDSLAVDPLTGQHVGCVGRIAGEEVCFTRSACSHRPRVGAEVDSSLFVPLVACYPGMDGSMIRAAVQSGARGLVVEGFGAGNVPPGAEAAMVEAAQSGLPVVLATRCVRGGVWPVYGYQGGAASLLDQGVLSARSLSGTKAQLLLKVALGAGLGLEEISELLQRD